MATTVRDIAKMLNSVGIGFDLRSETEIVTGFADLSNYRSPHGAPGLTLVIQLSEEGRYFTLFAPMAYQVPDHRAAMFLQACAMIQWKTKLIQFEYDGDDGEVRPVVEFPLEDTPLSQRQLMRCITGLAELIDQFHPVLQGVVDRGVIEFEDQDAMALLHRLLAAARAAEQADSPADQRQGSSGGRRLGNIQFVSTDHVRYQNGRDVSGHNEGCKRGIKVEPNISGGEGYTVTMHNLDRPHSAWGDNVQMAPKQMRVVQDNGSAVELRGFGSDPMSFSFSDYGITLHFDGSEVEKAVLHMHDRNIDIEYLK